MVRQPPLQHAEKEGSQDYKAVSTAQSHIYWGCMRACSFMYTCVKKKEMTAVNGYLGEEVQGERQE